MPNSMEHARDWLNILLSIELPKHEIFALHVKAGSISSLCKCGCHGFGFEIPEDLDLMPLASSSGLFCEVFFKSNGDEDIDILLFADDRGYFSGADVIWGPNIEAMPDDAKPVSLIEILY